MSGHEDEQEVAELDQTSSDTDQSASDMDQTLSDADQMRAQRDQIASDHDQEAADLDQAASDRANGSGDSQVVYERSRRMRAESALERDSSSQARKGTALARDAAAEQRDRISTARDLAAEARDELAAALDAELTRQERTGAHENGRRLVTTQALLRIAQERRHATEARKRAAIQRKAAAEDREHAANDRRQAALDREVLASELASAEVDEVTGALRRRIGFAAIQREIDRTRRTGEQLIVAFIDVDGLKRVNDERGHAAGDDLLANVVHCVHKEFRSYDLITRFGGDEFICVLAGGGVADIAERFKRIAVCLEEATPGASISVGFSQCHDDDTLESLIDRADKAMLGSRRTVRRGGLDVS